MARELESGWVFVYGIARFWLVASEMDVGVPGRACKSSALDGEVSVMVCRKKGDPGRAPFQLRAVTLLNARRFIDIYQRDSGPGHFRRRLVPLAILIRLTLHSPVLHSSKPVAITVPKIEY
jgi:hypothetical protein